MGYESDFVYRTAQAQGFAEFANGEVPVSLSVFADRHALRATMRDDAIAAGLHVACAVPLADLSENGVQPLGDVVLIDCPQVDGATLAALARIDERAVHACARLIVSTTMEALDDVFGCMDQSSPLLLVDPDRADRVLALGRVLTGMSTGGRVRELSENDRLMLLRLTEQVGQIAGQIERLAPGNPAAIWPEPGQTAAHQRHGGGTPASLPDPRLLRRIIRQRQLRQRFIGADIFADPAWDMLLDLAAARAENRRVSITSLCIAANVPPTTALRWISQLVEAGLFLRICDETDKRRAFIELSNKAAEGMARYFAEIGLDAPVPV